jgi:hypothetical protein
MAPHSQPKVRQAPRGCYIYERNRCASLLLRQVLQRVKLVFVEIVHASFLPLTLRQ